jgi:hypothetical protein
MTTSIKTLSFVLILILLIPLSAETADCERFGRLFSTKEQLEFLGQPVRIFPDNGREIHAYGFGMMTVFFVLENDKVIASFCLDLMLM